MTSDKSDPRWPAGSAPELHHDVHGGVEMWISHEEAGRIFSGNFWNDEEAERGKEWWITEENHQKLLAYLKEANAYEEFSVAAEKLRADGRLGGRVLEAGAGTCWSAALWSRVPEIVRVDAVELSWHRISTLASPTIKALDGDPKKINRIFGSFTDIRRPDATYDIISMASAFHHCEDPVGLIAELDRCLTRDGVIVLLGERPVGAAMIARRFAASLVKRGKLHLSFSSLFAPVPEIGDHYYRPKDYVRLFSAAGFDVEFLPIRQPNCAIVATRSDKRT